MSNYKKYFEELNKLDEELLFEMANIHPEESGIKPMLYSTFDGAHSSSINHGARVKVETINNGLFPILIDPDVKPYNKHKEYDNMKKEDKELVDVGVEYVKKYHQEFLAHWNGKIKDYELHDILRGRTSLNDILHKDK